VRWLSALATALSFSFSAMARALSSSISLFSFFNFWGYKIKKSQNPTKNGVLASVSVGPQSHKNGVLCYYIENIYFFRRYFKK